MALGNCTCIPFSFSVVYISCLSAYIACYISNILSVLVHSKKFAVRFTSSSIVDVADKNDRVGCNGVTHIAIIMFCMSPIML